MFLKNLFRKDVNHYLEKGERLLAAERFADARCAFQDALEKLDRSRPDADAVATDIGRKLAEAGNRLGCLNLNEAEFCVRSGDLAKAEEHLQLVIDLADDVTIREKAEKILASLSREAPPQVAGRKGEGCGTCHDESCQPDENTGINETDLSPHDRFELLVRPLPGDLPGRYVDLGEKFANGYLASDAGDEKTARAIYNELLSAGESDIVLYELALLHHREGDAARCESLLRRALALNGDNPLCLLALAHLLTDAGHFGEAVELLQSMIGRGILREQARMILGDVLQHTGEEAGAIEQYTALLSSPYKREAVERLIPILEKNGRSAEAQHLFKSCMKGCC